jgi:hypothetical protein
MIDTFASALQACEWPDVPATEASMIVANFLSYAPGSRDFWPASLPSRTVLSTDVKKS